MKMEMTGGIDQSRLNNITTSGGKTIAQCPACVELGKDSSGNHLYIASDNSFGCIAFQGAEGIEHRKRIFALAGTIERTIDCQASKPEAKPKKTWESFQKAKEAIGHYNGTVAGEWVYEDAQGETVLIMVRYAQTKNGKKEKSYYPFHKTVDGWVTGIPQDKLPLPLLNLKSIPTANRVYICEGEKCVDALASIGLTAVTSQGGAKASHRTDWTTLAGKELIILPDNDPDGASYADSVANICKTLDPPARGAILELPEVVKLGEGADIADYLRSKDDQPSELLKMSLEQKADKALARLPKVVEPIDKPTEKPLQGQVVSTALPTAEPEAEPVAKQVEPEAKPLTKRVEPPQLSTAKLQEIEAEIAPFRQAGKEFIEYLQKQESEKETTEEDETNDVLLSSANRSYSDVAKNIFTRFSRQKTMYYRGGKVLTLTDNALEMVGVDSFRSKIEKLGPVMRWGVGRNGKAVKQGTHLSHDESKTLLATDERTLLPRIKCVVNAPVIAMGGNGKTEKLGKGYHEKHALLVLNGKSDDMSLEAAKALILELFSEFDFTAEGDRARAIAALLTPALKMGGWLPRRCPMFAIEADAPQGGKGYLSERIFDIYDEVATDIVKQDGGVGSLDEKLANAFVKGNPFVRYDNIRGQLKSEYLESAMTNPGNIQCRIPFHGEISIDATPFSFFLTSNGVELNEDMSYRACMIRIRKRVNYVYKTYPEGYLDKHVKANRSKFLGAVHAVIAAHAEKGMPTSQTTEHDFREWAQLLDSIITDTLGLKVSLFEGHEEAKKRVANPAISMFRALAIALQADGRLGEEVSASDLADLAEKHDIPLPNIKDTADEDQRRKCVGILASRAFDKEANTMVVDNFQATRKQEQVERFDGKGFRSLWRYVFSIVPPPELPDIFESEKTKNEGGN